MLNMCKEKESYLNFQLELISVLESARIPDPTFIVLGCKIEIDVILVVTKTGVDVGRMFVAGV